jgi:hypothetical protein
MLARRGHPQGRLSIHGLSATSDGSSMIKITAGSKARLSAIWPRKAQKCYSERPGWYITTKIRTDFPVAFAIHRASASPACSSISYLYQETCFVTIMLIESACVQRSAAPMVTAKHSAPGG